MTKSYRGKLNPPLIPRAISLSPVLDLFLSLFWGSQRSLREASENQSIGRWGELDNENCSLSTHSCHENFSLGSLHCLGFLTFPLFSRLSSFSRYSKCSSLSRFSRFFRFFSFSRFSMFSRFSKFSRCLRIKSAGQHYHAQILPRPDDNLKQTTVHFYMNILTTKPQDQNRDWVRYQEQNEKMTGTGTNQGDQKWMELALQTEIGHKIYELCDLLIYVSE